MAYQIVDAVLKRSRSRSGDRLVLVVLANHADARTRIAWPSVATIAAQAALSPRQVKRALRHLLRLGEIAIAQRGGGSHRTVRYQINLPPTVSPTSPFTPPPAKGDKSARTVTPTTMGMTCMTENGDAHVTRTVINRHVNRKMKRPSPPKSRMDAAVLDEREKDVVRALRDAGVRYGTVRRELAANPDLTAEVVQEIAESIESHDQGRLDDSAGLLVCILRKPELWDDILVWGQDPSEVYQGSVEEEP